MQQMYFLKVPTKQPYHCHNQVISVKQIIIKVFIQKFNIWNNNGQLLKCHH